MKRTSNKSHDSFLNKKLTVTDYILSDSQDKAVKLANQGVNLFITGPPGTGKSFIINIIVNNCKNKNKNVYIVAFTGVAAELIDGCTIHSFSGIPYDNNTNIYNSLSAAHKYALERWKTVDVLIIDECSMVSDHLLFKLDIIAKVLRNSTKPFGGIQVIMTGDFYQLAPVEGAMCFNYPEWNNIFSNNVVVLEQVFRQKDELFLKSLAALRQGILLPEFVENVKSTPSLRSDGILPTCIYSTNNEVDNTNLSRLKELKQPIITFPCTDTIFKKQEFVSMIPVKVDLAIGAQVMYLVNDKANNLVNGSRGVIKDFRNGLPVVKFMNSEDLILVTYKDFDIRHLGQKIGTRSIIPLKLAWAITIHKSQGQTIEFLHVDLSKVFCEGQAYVAISRATSLETLSITGLAPNKIKVDKKVIDFYNSLQV
jgi:ATP-dependent DNA helicase PIF1